jgi:hypothetical protein
MLLSELEVAAKINHPYFNGDELSDVAKKKRVRQRAREARVNPVVKKHNIWLFHEDDVESLMKCHSKLRNERIAILADHRVALRRARTRKYRNF